MLIHLGHAVGKDLDSLEMTMPVLMDEGGGAKEVSIAPANKRGVHYNLVESSASDDEFTYSTVRTAIAEDMGSRGNSARPFFIRKSTIFRDWWPCVARSALSEELY